MAFFIGVPAAGFLMGRFGWRSPFLALASLGLAGLLGVRAVLGGGSTSVPAGPGSSSAAVKGAGHRESYKAVVRSPAALAGIAVICYSEERAEKDLLHRENILEKIKDKIKSGNLSAIVDNTHYKRFLRIRGEKPVIDRDKVKRDAIYDGMFVLTTNTNQSAVSVVEAYKDLWQVELAFRQLKSELEMGPIYHWKDRRIRAHVMICFLAFVLRTVFYKKLKKKDRNVSYTAIMADVKALRTCEVSGKGEKIKLRTELEPGAVKAFWAIGMRPPSHLLSKVTLEGVVIRQ